MADDAVYDRGISLRAVVEWVLLGCMVRGLYGAVVRRNGQQLCKDAFDG